MTETTDAVAGHYARADLSEAILAALGAAGKDVDALTLDDLAAVDEFHVRGREATGELAAAAGITAAHHVLDVGCGIGGPSRYLAATFGCRVTGLDLTEEYCRVAAMLAARTGLAERVAYRQGDALALPFEDATFDVVWTQHAAMNIADKARLYAEMWRVLRSGGRLALYDIVAGPGGPVHFPVPWAREESISFLVAPDELRALLETAGFEIAHWRDATAEGREWYARLRAQVVAGDAPLTALRVLFGEEWQTIAANLGRNLEEDRIALAQAVARRPG